MPLARLLTSASGSQVRGTVAPTSSLSTGSGSGSAHGRAPAEPPRLARCTAFLCGLAALPWSTLSVAATVLSQPFSSSSIWTVKHKAEASRLLLLPKRLGWGWGASFFFK